VWLARPKKKTLTADRAKNLNKIKKKKKKGNGGFVHMAYSCWRTFAARSSSLLAAVSFYF